MLVGGLTIGNEMKSCEGKWTWEVGKKKTVINHLLSRGLVLGKMVIEGSGRNDIGLDYNLL